MTKILVVAGHSRAEFKRRMIGEAIKRLQENPENDIYYLDCHGILKGYCGLCRRKHIFGYCNKCYPVCLGVVKECGIPDDHILPLKKFKAPKFPKFNTIQEAIDYDFEGYNFGVGPVSCMMTITRDYDFDIKKHLKDIHGFFETEYIVLRNIQELDNEYKFDVIHTFNGRMPFVYPVISYCKKEEKPFVCYTSGAIKDKMTTLYNAVPHDFYNRRDNFLNYWQNVSEKDREKFAKKWFEERRNGVFQSVSSFVKNQTKNALPNGFNTSKENIAIFNTSIDEVIAFKSWEHPFAKNENEILEQLFEHYKNDSNKHFWLRVHPNLAKSKRKHSRQMVEINMFKKKFPNLTVIEPEEKVDTYALIEASNKVVVSYSTTGVEATYWGTPSIVVGKALYDNMDCAYVANSMDELYQLIDNKKLKPKPKENSYNFGCSMQIFGDEFRYYKVSAEERKAYV